MSLDLKHPWDVIELLAYILADALQAATALALGIFWLVTYFPPREGCRQRHAAGLLFRRRGGLLLQSLDLEADRLDVRIDAFIEKRTLQHIHLLAASIEAIAPQDRHLVGKLVDLQLLGFEFLVAGGEQRIPQAQFSIAFADLRFSLGELREQCRRQIPQCFCVHRCELARGLHGLNAATTLSVSTDFPALFLFRLCGSLRAHRAAPTAAPP